MLLCCCSNFFDKKIFIVWICGLINIFFFLKENGCICFVEEILVKLLFIFSLCYYLVIEKVVGNCLFEFFVLKIFKVFG